MKLRLYSVSYNVTFRPGHRQAGAPIINIQSTLPTAPNSCKNVSLAVTFGSNGNAYADMFIYTLILHNAGWEKEIMPRKSFHLPFWARVS